MPIETIKTADTAMSDDEVVRHLADYAQERVAAAGAAPGDVVEVDDEQLVATCRLLRPFGVVAGINPGDRVAHVALVNTDGFELILPVRTDRLRRRS